MNIDYCIMLAIGILIGVNAGFLIAGLIVANNIQFENYWE